MSPESRPPYIEFENVQVRYTPHVHGLRGITLTIRRGDFVFFVGKTGAGKSTLLKLLTREVRHDEGIVRFHGRDLGQVRDRDIPALRREMGIVPQDFALLPRKRVWENVAYAMRAVGNSRRTVRKRVPEILERVNVGHRADAFPHELSGGEQQRVAIGRALINNPPLILADEPTGNLDPQHSWEIMELLRSLNARGATVLVATHDMTVVERMARRIVTLELGEIVHDTAPEGVMFANPLQHELEWEGLSSLPSVQLVTPSVRLIEPEPVAIAEQAEATALQGKEAVVEIHPEPETDPRVLLLNEEPAADPDHVEGLPDGTEAVSEVTEEPSSAPGEPEVGAAEPEPESVLTSPKPKASEPEQAPTIPINSAPAGTITLKALPIEKLEEVETVPVAAAPVPKEKRQGPKRDKSRPPLDHTEISEPKDV